MYTLIKTYLLLVTLLTATTSFTQNVNGHWYGIGMLQTTGTYNNYLSELILKQKGKTVSGLLNYYFKDSLIKVPISGGFDEPSHQLIIKPFPVIYYRSPSASNSIDCFMSGSFVLLASKAGSILSGSLFGDANHRYTVPNISFRLTKSDDTVIQVIKEQSEETHDTVIAPIKTPDTQTTEAFSQRDKYFTKEIEVTGSTLRLELYDNGEVDYDSVSLFFNNRLILPKTKLDHKAIRLTIELDPSLAYNELSMFAENLGMIPPNTAALILYDGKNRYETLLTSDLRKSATLRLKRKK